MKSLKSFILGLFLMLGTPIFSVAAEPVFAPLPVVSAQVQSNQAKAQAALDAYMAALNTNPPVIAAPAPTVTPTPKQKSNAPVAKAVVASPAPVTAATPTSPAVPSVTTTSQPNVIVVVPSEAKGNSLTRVFEASSAFVKNHVGIDIAIVLSALLLGIVIEWKRIFTWFQTLFKIFTVKKPAITPVATPAPIIVTPTSVTTSIPAGVVLAPTASADSILQSTSSIIPSLSASFAPSLAISSSNGGTSGSAVSQSV